MALLSRSIVILALLLSGLTACSSNQDVNVTVPKCAIDQPLSPGCNHSPTENNSH